MASQWLHRIGSAVGEESPGNDLTSAPTEGDRRIVAEGEGMGDGEAWQVANTRSIQDEEVNGISRGERERLCSWEEHVQPSPDVLLSPLSLVVHDIGPAIRLRTGRRCKLLSIQRRGSHDEGRPCRWLLPAADPCDQAGTWSAASVDVLPFPIEAESIQGRPQ